jgi:hypothetical protein
MRIDKQIRLMLRKQTPAVRSQLASVDSDYPVGMEELDEFEYKFHTWAQSLVDEFMGSPTIDLIAADYGTTIERLFTGPTGGVTFLLKLLPPEDNNFGGWASKHGIEVHIPWNDYVNDMRGSSLEIMSHELGHVADMQMVTDEGTGWGFWEWITSPDEQQSMKSEITNMMFAGYSDEIIEQLLYQKYYHLLSEQDPEDTVKFLEVLREQIREATKIYNPLVTR